jgi:flavin-dependent dehydrogenase
MLLAFSKPFYEVKKPEHLHFLAVSGRECQVFFEKSVKKFLFLSIMLFVVFDIPFLFMLYSFHAGKEPAHRNNRHLDEETMKRGGRPQDTKEEGLKLTEGSHVAVIGGGPAGSFFSYFLLAMAERFGTDLSVDIYESRNFSNPGPAGCNMCGGIISESLVQTLATEGINLPFSVVQRGIDSYLLHMDVGSVKIVTPLQEKRIGAVHRGAGPRGITEADWESFDGFLLKLALEKGANHVYGRVDEIGWENGRPWIKARGKQPEIYDLVAVAVGVNSATIKLFQDLGLGYEPPRTTKTYICEYSLGRETIVDYLGSSMHTFLLNLPRLEFAALIPKGDYATVCMLGKSIDKELVQSFLETSEVKQCLPSNWQIQQAACQCMPKINIKGSARPFGNRFIFIGDCGISRLYKDGIGAAYRTAKAAATTAIFSGVSAEDFKARFWPACKRLEKDNQIGKLIFFVVGQIQKIRLARRAILRMVTSEQKRKKGAQRMSLALWDMFTGSAPYREVFMRMFHPFFWGSLLWSMAVEIWPFRRKSYMEEES